MTDQAFKLALPSSAPLYVHHWPIAAPRFVVLIVHGMGEHGGRYARFARALNAAGAAVYAPDLPGHGHSVASRAELGHFADRGGWRHVLASVEAVRAYIGQHHDGLPVFLFGHSMGSFVSQHVVVEHGQGLAGLVLSATTDSMGPLRRIGLCLMRLTRWRYGPRYRSRLGHRLSFEQYNERFAPNRSEADWLTRDLHEQNRRVADPLCGQLSSVQLWIDLLEAGARLRARRRLARIPKSLPVLLVSGTDDAVSDGGKGSERLAAAYRNAGLIEARVMLYPQGRHELLNDTCREQVTADVCHWMQHHLPVPAPGAARPRRRSARRRA